MKLNAKNLSWIRTKPTVCWLALCLGAFQLVILPCVPSAPNTPTAWAYVDPTTGAAMATRVLEGFDPPAQKWSAGHRGVDLALSIGSDVRAAGDGEVYFVGKVAGKPVVSIAHADGVRTTYQPVFGHVSKGDKVREGQVIGRLAPPVDGKPGLHWGALIDGPEKTYIDPLSLLDAPVIRLKPVDGP
ncbi:MAG: M23 family metallopeptidase [Corynebacterium striatum]|uniref:M23 family metallopeptidase n=1 Tax=uncultured Corynebacterium sp. TaxID=159447 RepID=UPI00288A100A|nr:M23 family metallopeptidase [uncultured Corynebacterium sp.]MDU3176131.1 M23 family metallopeptidase [Corynebacterium striatum]